MIRKVFRYVSPMWTGNDGKFSVRAFLALVFSGSLLYNVAKSLNSLEILVAVVSRGKDIDNADAMTIQAVGSALANAGTILMIEAGLIVSLLGLTTIQNIQFGKKDNANHINNVDNL